MPVNLNEKLSRQLMGGVSRYNELPAWMKSDAPLQASAYSGQIKKVGASNKSVENSRKTIRK
jgi:hypothetical protein